MDNIDKIYEQLMQDPEIRQEVYACSIEDENSVTCPVTHTVAHLVNGYSLEDGEVLTEEEKKKTIEKIEEISDKIVVEIGSIAAGQNLLDDNGSISPFNSKESGPIGKLFTEKELIILLSKIKKRLLEDPTNKFDQIFYHMIKYYLLMWRSFTLERILKYVKQL